MRQLLIRAENGRNVDRNWHLKSNIRNAIYAANASSYVDASCLNLRIMKGRIGQQTCNTLIPEVYAAAFPKTLEK